ncbi:MAG: hypothetical protein QNJ31_09180 [Candidatus Caenarcaniphilales bacterium]|nr:hypothetical protein [Candidatus Caenarcaniphilales bacterium]
MILDSSHKDLFAALQKPFNLFFLILLLISQSSSEQVYASITSFPQTNNKTLSNITVNSSTDEEDFSKSLESAPSFLKQGEIFNLEVLNDRFKGLKKEMKVVEVPQWLYGTWKSNKQVQDFAYIYGKGPSNKSIEVSVDTYDVVGDIKSSDDKIYSIVSPGIINVINRSKDIDEYQIRVKDDRRNEFISFISKDLSIRVQIDPLSKMILKVFQVESEITYRPTFQGNSIIVDGWMKSFDENGVPMNFTHVRSFKQLTKRHQLIDLSEVDSEKAKK